MLGMVPASTHVALKEQYQKALRELSQLREQPEAQAARLRPAERPRQRALDDWRLYADRSGPAGGADGEGDESVPQTGEVDAPPEEAQVGALSCARSLAPEARPCRAAPRPCGGACGAAPGAAAWGAVPWRSRSSGVMRGHGAVTSPRPAVFEFREAHAQAPREFVDSVAAARERMLASYKAYRSARPAGGARGGSITRRVRLVRKEGRDVSS